MPELTATLLKIDVMIVDDEPDIRETLAEILRDEGMQVETAEDGADALEKLRGLAACRIILLDLMMPGMNGWQFRERQRQDPRLSRIPVLLLSGSAQLEEEASSLGALDCFTKPVELNRLIDLIKNQRAA